MMCTIDTWINYKVGLLLSCNDFKIVSTQFI